MRLISYSETPPEISKKKNTALQPSAREKETKKKKKEAADIFIIALCLCSGLLLYFLSIFNWQTPSLGRKTMPDFALA